MTKMAGFIISTDAILFKESFARFITLVVIQDMCFQFFARRKNFLAEFTLETRARTMRTLHVCLKYNICVCLEAAVIVCKCAVITALLMILHVCIQLCCIVNNKLTYITHKSRGDREDCSCLFLHQLSLEDKLV